MQFPAALRQMIDDMVEGVSLKALNDASNRLSLRYRRELKDGKMHLDSTLAAQAYLVARMPATFAAIAAVFEHLQQSDADFAPKSLLDCGAGPGTVLLAAAEYFPTLEQADLFEQSRPIANVGQKLMQTLPMLDVRWHESDLRNHFHDHSITADLVTLAYVLDELQDESQDLLVDHLWDKTAQRLLLVEPGTPAGWQRLMRQRARLIAKGALVLAPCPHQKPCPLDAPDWCHFAARLGRSKMHRLTKAADVPWEDEKYAYLVLSRQGVEGGIGPEARVLAPPLKGSGKVRLKLCQSDGHAQIKLVSKSQKELFPAARRVEWGEKILC